MGRSGCLAALISSAHSRTTRNLAIYVYNYNESILQHATHIRPVNKNVVHLVTKSTWYNVLFPWSFRRIRVWFVNLSVDVCMGLSNDHKQLALPQLTELCSHGLGIYVVIALENHESLVFRYFGIQSNPKRQIESNRFNSFLTRIRLLVSPRQALYLPNRYLYFRRRTDVCFKLGKITSVLHLQQSGCCVIPVYFWSNPKVRAILQCQRTVNALLFIPRYLQPRTFFVEGAKWVDGPTLLIIRKSITHCHTAIQVNLHSTVQTGESSSSELITESEVKITHRVVQMMVQVLPRDSHYTDHCGSTLLRRMWTWWMRPIQG